MNLPSFDTYGNYKSSNYGANALVFTIGTVKVYFSYKTPVAFSTNGNLVVRENEWGPTTGKHLNWIDGGDKESKAERVSGAEFEEMLARVLPEPNVNFLESAAC